MKRLLALSLVLSFLLYAEAIEEQVATIFKVKINLNFPNNSSVALKTEDIDHSYHDEAILILPKNYTDSGTPTRLVYCAHGAGGGLKDGVWALGKTDLVDSLLENGYACFDVNGGKNLENMGGNWVVQSANKAYEHIRENYNVYDEIFVIGLSMGGLSSSNFVSRRSNIVLAHGMFSPVLSLKDQAWDNPWHSTTRKSIAAAFDFEDQTGNTWEAGKVRGWDPIHVNTFQTETTVFKIQRVPVKIWHGSRDRVVKIETSRNYIRFIKNSNGYGELRELDSDNHGLSIGSPFLNKEMVLFLKRFDR